jgi:hypothetical protein
MLWGHAIVPRLHGAGYFSTAHENKTRFALRVTSRWQKTVRILRILLIFLRLRSARASRLQQIPSLYVYESYRALSPYQLGVLGVSPNSLFPQCLARYHQKGPLGW